MTASLDFATLLAYVWYLKAKPAVRDVWRGDAVAVGRATSTSAVPRSLNSVNASMRCPRAFVLWLFEVGRLAANPFARKYRGCGRTCFCRELDEARGFCRVHTHDVLETDRRQSGGTVAAAILFGAAAAVDSRPRMPHSRRTQS